MTPGQTSKRWLGDGPDGLDLDFLMARMASDIVRMAWDGLGFDRWPGLIPSGSLYLDDSTPLPKNSLGTNAIPTTRAQTEKKLSRSHSVRYEPATETVSIHSSTKIAILSFTSHSAQKHNSGQFEFWSFFEVNRRSGLGRGVGRTSRASIMILLL